MGNIKTPSKVELETKLLSSLKTTDNLKGRPRKQLLRLQKRLLRLAQKKTKIDLLTYL
jgi:hypothetical protein